MKTKNIFNEVLTPEKHGEIRKKFRINGDTWNLESDAVVIGSGAGGAVAAAELASRGWKVVLVEEGSFFNSSTFSSDEAQSIRRMYRDGGAIAEEEGRVSILQGRTLGGSTTVNWQASLYPPDFVTDIWKKRFGLTGYDQKSMQPYIDSVAKRISVHTVPGNFVNANNSVLKKGGPSLGLKPESLKNNSKNCTGLGRCGLGCPVNAKQSMFLTYIPDAIDNDAIVITNMRAVKITDGKIKKVESEIAPDVEKKLPPGAIRKLIIHSPVVIVSAGAVETPALLLRSGLGNDLVGKNLKIHPTMSVFARFKKEVRMFEGIPQSIVINGEKNGSYDYSYWLEAAPYRPMLVSSLIPYFGKEQFNAMKNFRNFQAGIVLARDGEEGTVDSSVEWSSGRRKVFYKLSEKTAENMRKGIQTMARIQIAAGATEIILPFRRFTEPIAVKKAMNLDWILKEPSESFFTIGSAHPHGSVSSSSDSSKGAVNEDLELFGHKNIYVLDASIFPTGLGVNPQIATMTACMRAARKLASRKTKVTV